MRGLSCLFGSGVVVAAVLAGPMAAAVAGHHPGPVPTDCSCTGVPTPGPSPSVTAPATHPASVPAVSPSLTPPGRTGTPKPTATPRASSSTGGVTVGHNHPRPRPPQLAQTGVPWWGIVSVIALAGSLGCVGLVLLLLSVSKDPEQGHEPDREPRIH